ncbi:MAG TPA: sigma-70 family RNA polymerase sigma factor [Candidatus Anoxymicrobiaceae bacterium]
MGKAPEEDYLKELIARAKEGDRRAYGKIFRLCYEDIFDYIARRVGNRSDAEDLTMHVFAKGLNAVSSYEDRGYSVKAWLYRIAHNAVVDHFRTQRPSVDLEDLPEIADDSNIEAMISAREELEGLYKEIAALPAAQAEVLLLRFVEDRSVAETAMILDKKEVTVRALQFKGIKNLRARVMEAEAAVLPVEADTRTESEY